MLGQDAVNSTSLQFLDWQWIGRLYCQFVPGGRQDIGKQIYCFLHNWHSNSVGNWLRNKEKSVKLLYSVEWLISSRIGSSNTSRQRQAKQTCQIQPKNGSRSGGGEFFCSIYDLLSLAIDGSMDPSLQRCMRRRIYCKSSRQIIQSGRNLDSFSNLVSLSFLDRFNLTMNSLSTLEPRFFLVCTCKLLHLFRYPHLCPWRLFLWSERNGMGQYCRSIYVFGYTSSYFRFQHGQSTSTEQMAIHGLHAELYPVNSLHDGRCYLLHLQGCCQHFQESSLSSNSPFSSSDIWQLCYCISTRSWSMASRHFNATIVGLQFHHAMSLTLTTVYWCKPSTSISFKPMLFAIYTTWHG